MGIYRAVVHSDGRDHYTGEPLDWSLVGQSNNAESKARRREYKATMALAPSIDHVGDGLGAADFKVCALRTNDAKSDLTHDDFVALCRRVVSHFDRDLQLTQDATGSKVLSASSSPLSCGEDVKE